MVGSSQEEEKTTTIAIIAIVAALAMLGVVVVTVAVTIPSLQQQAEAAGCESGFPNSARGLNASKGRCVGH
jgi:NADH:ubiquinone oxidoreductase subunit 3 (subunit A)